MNAWVRLMESVHGSKFYAKRNLKTLPPRERQAARKALKRAMVKYTPLIQRLASQALDDEKVNPADVLVLKKAGLLWQTTIFRATYYGEHCFVRYSFIKDGVTISGYIGFDRALNLVMVDIRSPENRSQTKIFESCDGFPTLISQETKIERFDEATDSCVA